jgi:hypothetical protein
MRSIVKYSALYIVIATALNISAVQAVNTSTAIKGFIQSQSGDALESGEVQIIHQTSGTVKTVTVNSLGSYRANGLRVGGPYTIIISADGYQSQEFRNVYLNLDEQYDLPSTLKAIENTEIIEIVASKDHFVNTGAKSVFSQQYINQAALVNRDIKDIVRANPLAIVDPTGNELSIAGSNPRFNSFTVDGVSVSDTFGLNNNGYPSQRPPISMNAISQISVDYVPFNTRANGFTGGMVNIVTKSGTNEFSGDIFYEFTPNNGKAIDDNGQEFPFSNDETTFGMNLGGPIINDTLFYFISYEEWSDKVVFNYDLDTLAGHKVTIDDANLVMTALTDVYGLTDSIGSAPPEDSDKKLLLKLDWNISDFHRLNFTYNHQDNSAAKAYTNNDLYLKFSSHQYSQNAETMLLTSHLFSDWSENFSSEINFSYKNHESKANTRSNWGQIRIGTDTGGYIFAGQERNRHANVKSNETTSFAFHGLYLNNDIDYKFGVEVDQITNKDLYARNGAGTWYFDSIAEFESKAPSLVQYGNAYTNNMQDLTAEIDSTKLALYVEASTELFNGFDMSAGIRYEQLAMDEAPNFNQSYSDEYRMSNTENMDGIDILLPRASFNWSISEMLTVRGGIGKFTGGMPLVWISNAYTNDGITNVSATAKAVAETIADPAHVMFDSVPKSLQDSLIRGNGSVSTIASDFSMPYDWRYQIAADVLFNIPALGAAGNNVAWTTEFIYVDRKDAAAWVDQARVKNDEKDETVDGRTIWGSIARRENFTDLQLTNSNDGGKSTIITTALNKTWESGASINTSYTYQNITEANPGTGTHAWSNYAFDAKINLDEPVVDRAYYEVEHRFVLNLGYQKEFYAGYNTSFNLFFERRSGRPFNWALGENSTEFGDKSKSYNYLPYLPSSASDPAFDFSQLSYDDTMAIANAAGVGQYAGGYIPKYVGDQPWLTTMDLAITQELPGLLAGHKGQLYFIIDNLANLINDDWGQSYSMSSSRKELFDFTVNDSGQYVLAKIPGDIDTTNYNQFDVQQSAWSLKVGVKYSF